MSAQAFDDLLHQVEELFTLGIGEAAEGGLVAVAYTPLRRPTDLRALRV